jgi:hypothetical protein
MTPHYYYPPIAPYQEAEHDYQEALRRIKQAEAAQSAELDQRTSIPDSLPARVS